MFLHPVDYGRKAEELLWRKIYSDVAMLLTKTNRKHMNTFKHGVGPLWSHLKGGLTIYEHLFLGLRAHYELRSQSYVNWPHSAVHLIGCEKVGPRSEEEVAWTCMACHSCLLYLGTLFHCQNEFLILATKDMAERYYYRALSEAPHMETPFDQSGALRGSKYWDIEAMYFHRHRLHSECLLKEHLPTSNDSDHAGKRYSHLKRHQGKKLSPSQR